MTDLPAAGYFNDPSRTNAQGKDGWDDMLAVMRETPGGAPNTILTISTGAITPTGATHDVDTEGGAGTDDLTNILPTNHPPGRLLLIRPANSARDIVVKDQAGGTGEIVLSAPADFVMRDTSHYLLLQERSNRWAEILRWYGQDNTNGWRPYFGLGDVSTQTADSFALQLTMDQAPLNEERGTDLATATNMDLGAVNGNLLDISGAGTIETFGVVSPGAGRVLRAITPFTIQHSASIVLPGGQDINCEVGDIFTVRSLGANIWIVTNYLRAAGVPSTGVSVSPEQVWSPGSAGTVALGSFTPPLLGPPKFAIPVLVMKVAKFGYAIGDKIVRGHNDATTRGVDVFWDNAVVGFATAPGGLSVISKAGNVVNPLVPSSDANIIIKAYR